jgi:hypothetical protein
MLLFLVTMSFSQQYIKVEKGSFKVVNYTLIEKILTYRVWDVNSGKCIIGGEMDYFDFYQWVYFTDKPGKYEIVIYLKNRVFIKEKVEIK